MAGIPSCAIGAGAGPSWALTRPCHKAFTARGLVEGSVGSVVELRNEVSGLVPTGTAWNCGTTGGNRVWGEGVRGRKWFLTALFRAAVPSLGRSRGSGAGPGSGTVSSVFGGCLRTAMAAEPPSAFCVWVSAAGWGEGFSDGQHFYGLNSVSW